MQTVRNKQLSKRITDIKNLITEISTKLVYIDKNDICYNSLTTQKQRLQKRVEMLQQMFVPSMMCVNLKCDITNAIQRKYTTLQEENTDEALYQLRKMYDLLIENNLLTEQDFMEVL